MEANIKENQITFSKGISNIPSDNLCDDNCLSDCIGLRMKDSELRPVQSPKEITVKDLENIGGTLLFIHKNTYKHFIYSDSGNKLHWKDYDGEITGGGDIDLTIEKDSQIAGIGNTLIVTTSTGLKYVLWKNGEYKVLGSIPEVSIKASTTGTGYSYLPDDYTNDDQKKAMSTLQPFLDDYDKKETEDYQSAEDEIMGLISGAFTKACKEKKFTCPFWMRIALRMYDGSYTMISTPVLVMPTVRRAGFVRYSRKRNSGVSDYYNKEIDANYSCSVNVTISVDDLSDYSDIIDKIVIFASDQVKTWGDGEDPIRGSEDEMRYDTLDASGKYISVTGRREDIEGTYTGEDTSGTVTTLTDGSQTVNYYYFPTKTYTDEEIIEKLIDTSVFYKIAEVPIDSEYIGTLTGMELLMKDGVLENLTTQEQLPHDDYYGHCGVIPGIVYTFNGRLQIADIKRIPYIGSEHFTSQESTNAVTATVKINGRSGVMYVSRKIYSYLTYNPCFFYYPDPNATDAYFMADGWSAPHHIKLTRHPRLNGAYWFGYLPSSLLRTEETGTYTLTGKEVDYEELDTTVMTSEVNNPWVFNAEGDNTVGTGKIVGIVSNTRALSQGQFGEHPLIVFTTEGIYALGTNSEGLYSTNYPLSREVCNSSKSITPTDGAVFFTTEKGLMMMVGADITNVSQQMMGKTDTYTPDSIYSGHIKADISFHDFLKDCVIAYDYRDYSLYLISGDSKKYFYVYDIKSGAITRQESERVYARVVNDYPDNILQDTDNKLWSLINKSEPASDTEEYSGMLLSRPVKMGNAQALKSLRQIVHVKDISGTMGLHVYVSNNLKNWGEIKSLKGTGWKYYRFGIVFNNLKATDSYSGMIAVSQLRRTDKMR